MRIFSKLSMQFHHPKDCNLTAVVRAGEFATVPDWVPESDMFKLAARDESVTVIESKADEIKAEKSANKRGNNRKNVLNSGGNDAGDQTPGEGGDTTLGDGVPSEGDDTAAGDNTTNTNPGE